MTKYEEETIYHYTSIETLVSIIKNQTIWATDYRGLNDSTEKTDYIEKAKVVFEKFDFPNSDAKKRLLFAVNYAKKKNAGVISFSKSGDLLSQWRSYADDGAGVSIGFRMTEIKNHHGKKQAGKLPNLTLRDSGNIYCKEMIYDTQKKNELLELQCHKLYKIEKDHKFKYFDSRVSLLPYTILSESLTFKNEGFKEEVEVRLIKSFRDYYDNDTDLFKDDWLKNKYDIRVVRGTPRLFYKHWFEKRCIRAIFIGPKCAADPDDIRLLLSHCGYPQDINILKSLTTYR